MLQTDCFLSASAFEIAKCRCRRKVRAAKNWVRLLWRFMQISHGILYIMNKSGDTSAASLACQYVSGQLNEYFLCEHKFPLESYHPYFIPGGNLNVKGHVHGELWWSILFHLNTYTWQFWCWMLLSKWQFLAQPLIFLHHLRWISSVYLIIELFSDINQYKCRSVGVRVQPMCSGSLMQLFYGKL